MAMRWGLGPVFRYEWLRGTRRWQVFAGRAAFVSMLLAALILVWWRDVSDRRITTFQELAAVGEQFFYTIMAVQLGLVMLVAPAATAGSICLEKAQGSLGFLLVTDLSDFEIVVGKLAARLVPVVGLIACTLPMMALNALLGGVEYDAVIGAFLLTLAVVVFCCALALTLSIWGRSTPEVLMVVYAALAIWMLVGPVSAMYGPSPPFYLQVIDPFRVLLGQRYSLANQVSLGEIRILGPLLLVASACLLAFAIVRLRPVTQDQRVRRARPRLELRWLSGPIRAFNRLTAPPLDWNPVLWREWYRRRPTRWVLIISVLYVSAATYFSAVTIHSILSAGGPPPTDTAAILNGVQGAFGLLLLSVSAATSLAEERVRGSLDVLMSTPLSTRSILLGKWWGTYRATPFLALWPMSVAAALASTTGRWEGVLWEAGLLMAYAAAITSVGLLLATLTSRLGRAVGACVASFLAVTIGWFLVVYMLYPNPDNTAYGLAAGSPFFGLAFPLIYVGGHVSSDPWAEFTLIAWALFWVTAYTIAAAVLLKITLAIFDQRLGRTPVWYESAYEMPRVWNVEVVAGNLPGSPVK